MVGIARAGGDAQLTMRANLGAGFVASVFGLEQRVFHDKMPWLVDHLPLDYEQTIERITVAGKFHFGPFPVLDGEDVNAFFRRILSPLSDGKTGLIFSPDGQTYSELPDRREVEGLWEDAHREIGW